jgi:hypothetical protein
MSMTRETFYAHAIHLLLSYCVPINFIQIGILLEDTVLFIPSSSARVACRSIQREMTRKGQRKAQTWIKGWKCSYKSGTRPHCHKTFVCGFLTCLREFFYSNVWDREWGAENILNAEIFVLRKKALLQWNQHSTALLQRPWVQCKFSGCDQQRWGNRNQLRNALM